MTAITNTNAINVVLSCDDEADTWVVKVNEKNIDLHLSFDEVIELEFPGDIVTKVSNGEKFKTKTKRVDYLELLIAQASDS
jgi:hypothetical protein